MVNLSEQPEGSSIEVREELHDTVLTWKKSEESGCARWGSAAFMSFWLIGWAVGEVSVIFVLKGMLWGHGRGGLPNTVSWGVVIFLVAWLGGWTIGGVAAMSTLRSLIRGGPPESITLGLGELRYDPGIARAPLLRGRQSGAGETKALKRVITIPRRDMPPLVLDWAGDRQRLSFDEGADRIEIGKDLREPDREWLAEVIEDWRK